MFIRNLSSSIVYLATHITSENVISCSSSITHNAIQFNRLTFLFSISFIIGIIISFDHSMYSVGENAGRVQISASLVQGGLGRPVEVLFNTMSGTATSEDPKDFQSLQGVVLQYNDTIHQAGVSVTIINDNIFEKEEKFFASLITNDANVNFGINNATITIYDYGDGKS